MDQELNVPKYLTPANINAAIGDESLWHAEAGPAPPCVRGHSFGSGRTYRLAPGYQWSP